MFFGLPILFALGPYVLAAGGLFYLGLRYVRAAEQRGLSQKAGAEFEERLAQLESSNAELTRELERLAKGQAFTTRLLTERTTSPGPAVP